MLFIYIYIKKTLYNVRNNFETKNYNYKNQTLEKFSLTIVNSNLGVYRRTNEYIRRVVSHTHIYMSEEVDLLNRIEIKYFEELVSIITCRGCFISKNVYQMRSIFIFYRIFLTT
jgi:hypothetical protein